MNDDDETTAVYPRAWARAIAAISLEDPEVWPDLEPEPAPEGAYACDALMAVFGLKRMR